MKPLPQYVGARIDPALAIATRQVARSRKCTVSDLLRVAMEDLVQAEAENLIEQLQAYVPPAATSAVERDLIAC